MVNKPRLRAAPGDNNSAYDNLNRLLTFQRGTLSVSTGNYNGGSLDAVSSLNGNADHSQVWTLDALGNQTSVNTDNAGSTTRTVNSQNELTAVGTTSLAYDNNGSTTADDQGHTLVYDGWNRLVMVKSGSTIIASYAYDADGSRIRQAESSATTDFYFSGGNTIEERQGSTVTAQEVWGLGYSNDLVLRDDNSTTGSYGITGSGLGERLYAQHDANWNVTALADSAGAVQERFVYTPYGARTVLSSSWAATSDAYNSVYGFQDGRQDPVSGLVHFGVRDYSTSLFRWVQQDPAGYIDGANRYLAMADAPASSVDPGGLCADTSSDSSGGDFGTSDSADKNAIRARLQQTIGQVQSGKYNFSDILSITSDMRALGRSVDETQDLVRPWVVALANQTVGVPNTASSESTFNNILRWLYTGDAGATDVQYNTAKATAGNWLYTTSPVRGGYFSIGLASNENAGVGKNTGAASVSTTWTIDDGADIEVHRNFFDSIWDFGPTGGIFISKPSGGMLAGSVGVSPSNSTAISVSYDTGDNFQGTIGLSKEIELQPFGTKFSIGSGLILDLTKFNSQFFNDVKQSLGF